MHFGYSEPIVQDRPGTGKTSGSSSPGTPQRMGWSGACWLHFDLPQLTVGVLCGGVQHLDEQLLGGKVGAAGRGQIAAAGQQLHGAVVDLLVAAHGVLHGAARLGEGRRVQNDKVVGVALFFQPGQQLKGVLAEKVHVGQTVALGVPLGHGNGLGADVGGGDAGSPALGGVQRKAAGVGKAVQHGVPGGKAGHRPAVVLLVEEEAGLLAVLEIHVVVNAVLADLGLGACRGASRRAAQTSPCSAPDPPWRAEPHRCARRCRRWSGRRRAGLLPEGGRGRA